LALLLVPFQMSKSCMNADGKTRGNACATDKTCTAPLACNQSTGLCDLSGSGNWKDACQTDADCNTKYPGLKCSTAGICDCTDSSGMLSLCSDTQVCASGSSPGPSPSPSSWPAAFTPPPPGDFIKNKFSGSCATSTWYNKQTQDPNCKTGNLGLLDNNSKPLCMSSADYIKQGTAFPGSYSKSCYIDA